MFPSDVVYTDPQPNLLGMTAPTDDAADDYQSKLDEFNLTQTASNIVTNHVSRVLTQQMITCYWHMPTSKQRLLQLPSWPVANKDSLTITDSDGNAYRYWLAGPNALHLYCAPRAGATVTIKYQGGYAKLPSEIINAVKSVLRNIRTEGDDYNAPVDFKTAGIEVVHDRPVKLMPPAVMTMLDAYKRIVV